MITTTFLTHAANVAAEANVVQVVLRRFHLCAGDELKKEVGKVQTRAVPCFLTPLQLEIPLFTNLLEFSTGRDFGAPKGML